MREYLLIAIVAAAITFITTPGIRWAAVRWNAVTPVRGRDVHTVPIPRLGGVALLLGFAAAILVAKQLPYLGTKIDYSSVLWVLAAAAIVTALGAIDDLRELDPLTKVAGTIVAALVMSVFGGVQLLFLPILGTQTYFPQSVLFGLTVLVVLATTQAVNFADGLDGLAAGTTAIAATAFFIWSYATRQNYDYGVFTLATFISAAVVGCCIGFLPHNFHPAKLFMGDAGSLLLGLLLSAALISFTGNFDPGSSNGSAVAILLPIALPVLVLALPVLDVLLAFVRRGGKFWHPDKKHLHHRLMRMGHPHRQAVLLLYLWSASVSGGVLLFNFLSTPIATAVLAGLIALCLVLTLGLPRLARH
ncbi:undecaprenyl-phosphate alpha-N-acetylglucosaminyl 1-phosphate transferase [Flexivirga endophytica]|uniref:Undecaprenyl-phosphate alpha-N-acetylglucosaminyl 1-phosphate transferase n=1 Tax=Flexivirga endophytica TaxID=1849103 RepID=A0A916SV32_9MICO|nr:MraY family glycosyltransferase [Flexivirga endophytica]GGB15376.1 undecaprenyl-phosphate alpha-N-acetylglucosaminyl 1-phosphate transferase [Flexivirga endophytica]GHB40194.1 undecaprenyl-phosphate alpha-N-acetylglucosaminyl 1-phosphate transferase [Flexivirga endophytica]